MKRVGPCQKNAPRNAMRGKVALEKHGALLGVDRVPPAHLQPRLLLQHRLVALNCSFTDRAQTWQGEPDAMVYVRRSSLATHLLFKVCRVPRGRCHDSLFIDVAHVPGFAAVSRLAIRALAPVEAANELDTCPIRACRRQNVQRVHLVARSGADPVEDQHAGLSIAILFFQHAFDATAGPVKPVLSYLEKRVADTEVRVGQLDHNITDHVVLALVGTVGPIAGRRALPAATSQGHSRARRR
mmetsp:Transcript_62503/g.151348  ORF Transcript_62503/g.151348 Transcript_62503/m.151348 type:complete len:241 (-) Transcript_62503:20-742(-)